MTYPRSRTSAALVTCTLCLAVVSAGCSARAEPDVDTATLGVSAGPGASSAGDSAAEPAARSGGAPRSPLALSTGTGTSVACSPSGRPLADLAWFDVTWKATQSLDSFSFSIVDPRGVQQIGGGRTVPPVNVGGSIAYGGSSTWRDRAKGFDSPQTQGSKAEGVALHRPATGETGLLALHLRIDPEVAASPKGATFAAVKATYALPDGTSGQTRLDIDQVWRRGSC